jgi:peroxiredoxin
VSRPVLRGGLALAGLAILSVAADGIGAERSARDALRAALDAPPAAPAFRVRTLTGERIELESLVRGGPVVLDFWATWCKPCLAALPELRQLHERFSARGVSVVGISEDGPRNHAKVRPFATRYRLGYPLVLDEDGSLQSKYQVRSLPTTFVVDRKGRITHVEQGYRPGFGEALATAIEAALADTASGPAE